jgi:Fur family peroxide stress response transcriptional regulator
VSRGGTAAGVAPARPRSTRQLDATLAALLASDAHPTAEDVFRIVRRRMRTIGLATVYRNLQKLAAQGRARIVFVPDRPTRFDGRTDRHDHFVCRCCGRVLDVEPTRAFAGRRRIAGHRVEEHALTYFGSCVACEKVRPSSDEGA